MSGTGGKSAGADAEDQALSFLLQSGLSLITRNYACRQGEIDLIMQEQQDIALIEVRLRSHGDFGTAIESVDHRKRQRLVAAARHWLMHHPQYASRPLRFDVIGIDGSGRLDWIRDAFYVEE